MHQPPPSPIAAGSFAVPIGEAYVYVAYGRTDEPLYVGVSEALFSRLAEHRLASRWYYESTRIEWEQFRDRAEAERAERLTIRRLRPKYNIAHNDELIFARTLGHSRRYPPEDWRRLCITIRATRLALGRSQRSIAVDADLPVARVRQIEAGIDDGACTRRELECMEYALGWAVGSLEAVLAGGEPGSLTPEERRERALVAYDYIARAV